MPGRRWRRRVARCRRSRGSVASPLPGAMGSEVGALAPHANNRLSLHDISVALQQPQTTNHPRPQCRKLCCVNMATAYDECQVDIGRTCRHWSRLSLATTTTVLICSAGVPVVVDFTEVMSPMQRRWLAQTLQPVRTSICVAVICYRTRSSLNAEHIATAPAP